MGLSPSDGGQTRRYKARDGNVFAPKVIAALNAFERGIEALPGWAEQMPETDPSLSHRHGALAAPSTRAQREWCLQRFI